MTPHQEKVKAYETQNREAAAIILREPARYGGQDSLMVQWAQMVVNGHEKQAREWRLVA